MPGQSPFSLPPPAKPQPQAAGANGSNRGAANGPAAAGSGGGAGGSQPPGGAPAGRPPSASAPGDSTRAPTDPFREREGLAKSGNGTLTLGGTVNLGTSDQRLGYVGGFNANAAPVFKPGGRYALPVELSGGTALGQFRKLKGDAELEITLAPVRKGPGLLPALWQLAVALAALWLVQRIHLRRQRRRAALAGMTAVGA